MATNAGRHSDSPLTYEHDVPIVCIVGVNMPDGLAASTGVPNKMRDDLREAVRAAPSLRKFAHDDIEKTLIQPAPLTAAPPPLSAIEVKR